MKNHTTRNIIIGVVVIVLGFAGYKLAGVYTAPKPDAETMLSKMDESSSKQSSFEAFLKPSTSDAATAPANASASVTPGEASVAVVPVPAPSADQHAKEQVILDQLAKDQAAKTTMSESTPLPPKPMTSTHESSESAGMSKDVEKKLSEIADQTAATKESLRHFENAMTSVQQSMDRMDQRISALDDQMRAAKNQQAASAAVAMKSSVQSQLMHHRHPRMTTLAHQVAMQHQGETLTCYRLVSMTQRSILLIRQDNNRRYEILRGARIPLLTTDDGRCVETGQSVELIGFNADTGAIHLEHGMQIDSDRYYAVEALVEGRAWLKNENGSIITVDRGAVLPGYGRVTAIDVQRGVVNTSSGKVIQFSTDER